MAASAPTLERSLYGAPSGSRALSARSVRAHPLAPTLDWVGIGVGAALLFITGRARMRGRASWVRALGAAAAAGGALDLLVGTRRARADHVRVTIRINREPHQLYRFWRELQNLPHFMQGVETVETASDGSSRWRGHSRAGAPVSWHVDLIADEQDRRIAWCSRPDSEVFHCGSVRFEPARGGLGTFVRMDLQSAWPAGSFKAKAARLLGAGAEQRVKQDLRRFKQLMETGEIATTQGQSSGRAHKANA